MDQAAPDWAQCLMDAVFYDVAEVLRSEDSPLRESLQEAFSEAPKAFAECEKMWEQVTQGRESEG